MNDATITRKSAVVTAVPAMARMGKRFFSVESTVLLTELKYVLRMVFRIKPGSFAMRSFLRSSAFACFSACFFAFSSAFFAAAACF